MGSLATVLWYPVLLIWYALATTGTDPCVGTGEAITQDTPKLCYDNAVHFAVFDLPGLGWALGMLIMLVGGYIAVFARSRPGWVVVLACLVCPACLMISYVVASGTH